jgi:hypothetical protein
MALVTILSIMCFCNNGGYLVPKKDTTDRYGRTNKVFLFFGSLFYKAFSETRLYNVDNRVTSE